MENRNNETDIATLKKQAHNKFIDMVQAKYQFGEISKNFYKTLIKYNIKDAKNVKVKEEEIKTVIEKAEHLLKQADEKKAEYDIFYSQYLSLVVDEYGFCKNERNQLKEDISQMHSYFKKFLKCAKKFEIEQEMGEE